MSRKRTELVSNIIKEAFVRIKAKVEDISIYLGKKQVAKIEIINA